METLMQDDIEKALGLLMDVLNCDGMLQSGIEQDDLHVIAFARSDIQKNRDAIHAFLKEHLSDDKDNTARSGWVLVSEIEKHFDFSKYGEHESIEMVAINDGQSEEWEHGRLQLKCDYDDGEKLKPAFGINHSYAECVFATDYKYFKRISPPPQSKGGEG